LPYFDLLVIFALSGCTAIATTEPKVQVPSLVAIQPSQASNNEAEHANKFALWVNEFSATARKAGIREETLRIAFKPIRFLPGVIELDRAQPEFNHSV